LRLLFSITWLVCCGVLFTLPSLFDDSGRNPSGTFPLDGTNNNAIRYQYLVYPKIHHTEYEQVRRELPVIAKSIEKYAVNETELVKLKDSLIDFGNPIEYTVLPPRANPCSEIVSRYEAHAAALKRALRPYWSGNGSTICNEIIVTVVDSDSDQHLDFKAVKRETGRVLILNDNGGALAQIILWRDDKTKLKSAFVQPLDPIIDIGSGFSIMPLDWPRLIAHRQDIKSVEEFRIPSDSFVRNNLKSKGQLHTRCNSQQLSLKFRDSWGRTASAQWCYGDSFPKTLENEHYFAFRVEE